MKVIISRSLTVLTLNRISSFFVPAAFSPGSVITGPDSMSYRSISARVSSDVKVECEANSETPNVTISSMIDGDATK